MPRCLIYGVALASLCLSDEALRANPPVASYIFPAGGRRGATVEVRVGGLFLHKSCSWELLGSGVEADRTLRQTPARWFEGPMLPLPESQQAEDYPRDLLGKVRIAADAELRLRRARLWTAEGAASGLLFQVGDLPEIVEQEIDGDPVPVEVKLPVTINGRIFPRENVDEWAVELRKGQSVSAEVFAARLGSPLDSFLEVLDPKGRVIAENDDHRGSPDSFLRFSAPADGKYRIRIRDASSRGGPAFVYRLTLTADPYVERIYPLGGRRGAKTRFEAQGQGMPKALEVALPAEGATLSHRFTVDGKLTNPVLLDLDDLPEHLEQEPNDAPEKAAVVTPPAVCNGRIDRPGDVDCWGFTARKGEELALELRTARLGSPLQGVLNVCDASGKLLASAEAGAKPDPELYWKPPADGTYYVRVADKFRTRGGADFAYRLRIAPPAGPGFRLIPALDSVSVPHGGQAKMRLVVERSGLFTGPIALSFDGLPAGVKASPASVPQAAVGVDLAFSADKSAAIDVAHLTIRGSAMINGKEVSHTAVLAEPAAETVLLAVALPAPFKIVGDYDMRWAARGGSYRRKYRVERTGFDGPLQISIADRQARHLQGVVGPTITVPAGATEFEYEVQLPPWMEIGRTCRVCVMAEGVVKDGDREHIVSYSSVGQNEQMICVVETGRLGVEVEKTSITATPGGTVQIPIKVVRGKGLVGPVKVELILPEHVRGAAAEPATIAAGEGKGLLTIHFARDRIGPFNMPALVRASVVSDKDRAIAETKLEIVPAEEK
jgi:hypothetical protein